MVYSGFIHTSWLPQTLGNKTIKEYFNQCAMLFHRNEPWTDERILRFRDQASGHWMQSLQKLNGKILGWWLISHAIVLTYPALCRFHMHWYGDCREKVKTCRIKPREMVHFRPQRTFGDRNCSASIKYNYYNFIVVQHTSFEPRPLLLSCYSCVKCIKKFFGVKLSSDTYH